jgi:hypothetical protein
MGAVAKVVEDVVGGVVEAVGSVVESIGDVVSDVGSAIDDYVIQPILDDPLTAIASVAAAVYLGPMAAAYFGTSAAVGTGLAVAGANTAAGLVQGESFDEAIKGGAMAGLTAGVGQSVFGGASGTEGASGADPLGDFIAQNDYYGTGPAALPGGTNLTPTPSDSLDQFLAQNDNFGTSAPSGPLSAQTSPVSDPNITTSELPPQGGTAPVVDPTAATSPLQTLNTQVSPIEVPSFNADYSLTSGMRPDFGLQVPGFDPSTSGFNLYGDANYNLASNGVSGGPGMQMPDASNLARMRGGQGITVDMPGLPQYIEGGSPATFTGAGGNTYGNLTPDVTVSQTAITPTSTPYAYDPNTNMGTPGVFDSLASGNLQGAAKAVGNSAVDWYKGASPWEVAGAGLGATTLLGSLGSSGPPSSQPNPGGTRDANFNRPLDLYEYMRDKTNYGGDLRKYGQVGQGGEHQYFQNTRFNPVPISAKMGGLIQMKHFAQGGQAQGMQDPRRAQMMQAMAQQRPAGQGMPQRGMPPQGRPPMMQGGAMPQRPMSPQNAQGGLQAMAPQGRPQMPQRPRDPKMAYYQYGNAPAKAMAMGGLSSVHSMKIGGGADGRSDDVPAVLSDGEYVMDAESVAMLGNGSSKAGAAKLDQMRSKLRQHKGQALANGKISPDARSPLSYVKGA